jgi:acyl-CoA synthetase (AMP-forming)/AMP-acid ligase II
VNGVSLFKITPDQTSVAGYPHPEARVEIVNEGHEPLPQGKEGLVRIRTPDMVREYYKNPEATAQSFRDGWFYPGDRGRLMRDGLLVLAGRDSELINRGGVKIDPVSIDQFLGDYQGISDAAVFGLENRMGIEDIGAAIVAAENFDMRALQQALLETFGKARSPSVYFKVQHIPRNEMGKVMRAHMSKRFAAILQQRDQVEKLTNHT